MNEAGRINPNIDPYLSHISADNSLNAFFRKILFSHNKGQSPVINILGPNGNGKSRILRDMVWHFSNFAKPDKNAWPGRERSNDDEFTNIYVVFQDDVLRTMREDFKILTVPPEMQDKEVYDKASIVSQKAISIALELTNIQNPGIIFRETQGLAHSSTLDLQNLENGTNIYEGLNYQPFYMFVNGSNEVVLKAITERLNAGVTDENGRLKIGSIEALKYYRQREAATFSDWWDALNEKEDSNTFFRDPEVLNRLNNLANSEIDLQPKIIDKILKSMDDFLRGQFIRDQLDQRFFIETLGLPEEDLGRRIVIHNNFDHQPEPAERFKLTEKYNLIAYLRTKGLLDLIHPENPFARIKSLVTTI